MSGTKLILRIELRVQKNFGLHFYKFSLQLEAFHRQTYFFFLKYFYQMNVLIKNLFIPLQFFFYKVMVFRECAMEYRLTCCQQCILVTFCLLLGFFSKPVVIDAISLRFYYWTSNKVLYILLVFIQIFFVILQRRLFPVITIISIFKACDHLVK